MSPCCSFSSWSKDSMRSQCQLLHQILVFTLLLTGHGVLFPSCNKVSKTFHTLFLIPRHAHRPHLLNPTQSSLDGTVPFKPKESPLSLLDIYLSKFQVYHLRCTSCSIQAHLLSRLDSMCHLTCELSSRFCGSGLAVGVPPTSII